ncbi:MAG: inorganic pyrophosphatase [Parcubacteria group bacterium Gr01-1014_30]|nr:MAG: inorganic pyrophosphatase [Parcubacteria group bacterium Gr01-1014_30]
MENKADKIIVFVEIPKGSVNKYEFDEELGGIKLDRSNYGPMHWPFEYGFIKDTKGEDGDPLDCVLLSVYATFPGCLVASRAIGMLEMEDEAGIDHKILALPEEKVDPRMAHIKELDDLPEHTKKEVREFFENYKNLEPGKWVKLKDFKGQKEAEKIIEEAKKRSK